jgi:hypothetical protein
MLEELLAYKAKHETFEVPRGEVIHHDIDLSMWVYNQRKGYKNAQEGKEGALSADRVRKLEKVGFDFSQRVKWDLRRLFGTSSSLTERKSRVIGTKKIGIPSWNV